MSLFSNFQFSDLTSGYLKRILLPFFAAALLQLSGCGDHVVESIEITSSTGELATDDGLDSLKLEPLEFDSHEKRLDTETESHAYTPVSLQEAVGSDQAQAPSSDSALKKAGDLFERAKDTTGETAMGAKDWVQDKIGNAAEASSSAAQKAGDLLKQAKDATGETAMGAKDWMQDKIGGATDASTAAAQDTLKWATETFESLKSQGLTTANNTSEWLSQDWKNMESWEYKIHSFDDASDKQKSDELNSLGKQGWECYHVSDIGTIQKFYLKKRKESFLRHLPFKDFIKLVPLMQQATR